jgi:hypothetical protein
MVYGGVAMVDIFIQVDLNTGKVEVLPDDGGFDKCDEALAWLEEWVDGMEDKSDEGSE